MKLSSVKLAAYDEELFDYKRVDREIAIRKLELTGKYSQDENLGGGRSSFVSKEPERLVTAWETDERIKYLKQFKNDVETLYGQLSPISKKIFEMRWINLENFTWEEIGCEVGYSRKQSYRKRESILALYDSIKKKKMTQKRL